MHPFVLVSPHCPLSVVHEGQAPFQHYQGFKTQIVDAEPSQTLIIIEPDHIISHLTTYQRPKNTYGIPRDTLVVCWALNRGRR